MTPERLAEIDISIAVFRETHPGSFGEIVAELRAEVDQLTSLTTALSQTIRAYPDAVANSAANIAHARAQRHTAHVERNEARKLARTFYGMAWSSFDRPASVFRQLGLDALPSWLTADSAPDAEDDA